MHALVVLVGGKDVIIEVDSRAMCADVFTPAKKKSDYTRVINDRLYLHVNEVMLLNPHIDTVKSLLGDANAVHV
jgi:hypothetical protein